VSEWQSSSAITRTVIHSDHGPAVLTGLVRPTGAGSEAAAQRASSGDESDATAAKNKQSTSTCPIDFARLDVVPCDWKKKRKRTNEKSLQTKRSASFTARAQCNSDKRVT